MKLYCEQLETRINPDGPRPLDPITGLPFTLTPDSTSNGPMTMVGITAALYANWIVYLNNTVRIPPVELTQATVDGWYADFINTIPV